MWRDQVDHEPAGQGEAGSACVRLWTRVVLQILADIEAGVRVLRAGPTAEPAAVEARSERMRDAHAAAAWMFGPSAWRDRAWICGWLGLEPGRLQEAVRRAHGNALDDLLTKG